MKSLIPVNEPLLDGAERDYLRECIDTGWISSEGPFVQQLEKQLAGRVGRKHAIAVCNGSAALDVAVAALQLNAGDEVIMPTFTIISCLTAILRAGAVPVLVDSDPLTWNMRVDEIAARITTRTKAIMAVHIYGLPVDMTPLIDLATAHGLKIIEDAAEALGATYKDRACGSFGDISVFSFYPNKHLTTGEGGMVLTDDDRLAERCRALRNLCFQPERRFVHEELGWNYRMSNLQAAVGVAQFGRLEEFLRRKKQMGRTYQTLLAGIKGIQQPIDKTSFSENCYWVYGLVLSDEIDFDAPEAIRRLAKLNVQTRPFFWPMHQQPILRRMGMFPKDLHPVSERIARRGFYIPSGLALTGEQMSEVATAVAEVLKS